MCIAFSGQFLWDLRLVHPVGFETGKMDLLLILSYKSKDLSLFDCLKFMISCSRSWYQILLFLETEVNCSWNQYGEVNCHTGKI